MAWIICREFMVCVWTHTGMLVDITSSMKTSPVRLMTSSQAWKHHRYAWWHHLKHGDITLVRNCSPNSAFAYHFLSASWGTTFACIACWTHVLKGSELVELYSTRSILTAHACRACINLMIISHTKRSYITYVCRSLSDLIVECGSPPEE